MSDFTEGNQDSGTQATATTNDLFGIRCDNTASGAEAAKKMVVLKNGGVIYLCASHARHHELALMAVEAVITDIPTAKPEDPPKALTAAPTA